MRMHVVRMNTRAVQAALVIFGLMIIVSCSHKAMSVMFDMPPPEPETEDTAETLQEIAQTPSEVESSNVSYWSSPAGERPPIESVTTWEEALEYLPTDPKGRVDWVAALRDGIVQPRALEPEDMIARSFQMDFTIPSDKPKFEAWFPHSAHTEWLGCRNCHGSVFKYASNEMSMKSMRKGEYCGACHNKVAFSLKECGRCHLAMKK